jgi:hypothetical protein
VSFLRRLFGQGSPQLATRIPSNYQFLPRGDGEHTIQVVGESNYQASLRWAANGVNTDGPNNPRVYAEIIPEPDNRFDQNAVKIQAAGRLVGSLARPDAAAYQRHLLPLMAAGRVPACEARIKGGYTTNDGYAASLGIELYVGRPDELAAANQVAGE